MLFPRWDRLLTVKEVRLARIWDVTSCGQVAEIRPRSPLEGQLGVAPTASPFQVFIESAALDRAEHILLGLNDAMAGVFRVSAAAESPLPAQPPN